MRSRCSTAAVHFVSRTATKADVVKRLCVGLHDWHQVRAHGDHLFYDRLQTSPDPAIVTSLRFQTLADADANQDGEITWAELDAAPLDIRLYDPFGFKSVTSQGAFVASLARTIGHFRGEGECDISAL